MSAEPLTTLRTGQTGAWEFMRTAGKQLRSPSPTDSPMEQHGQRWYRRAGDLCFAPIELLLFLGWILMERLAPSDEQESQDR